METTQQVREFAAANALKPEEAIEAGMREKAEEFRAKGGELYVKEGAAAG